MKILCVIPARYDSSRLPGKPLADICGKPMIWWVYQQVVKVKRIDNVVVATDDLRILNVCKQLEMQCILTSDKHTTHIDRLAEVASKIDADWYVCVCGDEPLIEPKTIEKIIPTNDLKNMDLPFLSVLTRKINDPAELIDPGNIKILVGHDKRCLALSRAVIPFPQKTLKFSYKKLIGVECYNKLALLKFSTLPVGVCEYIEDSAIMRFWENHIPMLAEEIDTYQLSVDTAKDLEKVIEIVKENIAKEQV